MIDREAIARELHLPHHRQAVDPVLAAARLELSTDALRVQTVAAGVQTLTAGEFGQLVDPTPEPDPAPAPAVDRDLVDAARQLSASSAGAADVGPAAITPAALPPSPAFSSERLNWEPRHDDASRAYGVADHRLTARAPLVDTLLPRGPVLDQGTEGACVGFATADAVNVLDLIRVPNAGDLLDAGAARNLYLAAQKLDDVPGESYSGTSVLAGMKAAKAAGLIGGYLWCFGVRDLAQTIVQLRQPVVAGVPLYEAMETTAPDGVWGLGGKYAGGHCVAVVGLVTKGPSGQAGPFFVIQNSWGTSWGAGGLAYVHHRDMAWLLAQDGEAAVPQVHL